MALLPGIVKSLFSLEDNPVRFENVCIDLYREEESVSLVPTSKTWDMGRDARSIGIKTGQADFEAVLCATLTTGLDDKVTADIQRLAETTKTKAIVFCTSLQITEHAAGKIEKSIRDLYPKVEIVRVLGQIQLTYLGEKHESVLRHHYLAEITNAEQALIHEPSQALDPEHTGLRLALITQTGDDAGRLRSELTRRLVLEVLQREGAQTPGQVAVKLTQQLHLPRSLSADYIMNLFLQFRSDGLLTTQDGKASLSADGVAFLSAIPQEASAKLLEGRSAIKEAIRTLSGHVLPDDHYETIWKTIQEGLAELFRSHGAHIVGMTAALISGQGLPAEKKPQALFEALGDRVGAQCQDPAQGKDVRQAVIDMFSEKQSDAFQWLTQICSVYVMMCSLGFEALSNQEVTGLLKQFHLVSDSDVIISLLCEAEPSHEEVNRLLRGWRAIGGKLLMSTPVLEEVAYNAWISEYVYQAVKDTLHKISEEDSQHLIENAFVRTFRKLAKGSYSPTYWNRFISSYRGAMERDYGPLLSMLRDDHGFDLLAEADEKYQGFIDQVKEYLVKDTANDFGIRSEELNYKLVDKLKRDAKLFGAVVANRAATREVGAKGTTIILSSGRAMKKADIQFRTTIGNPDGVVSIAALAFLMTLTPGIQMQLGTLRGVLFDMGLAAKLNPITAHAFRVIQGSTEFDLPWAKRGALQKELKDKIFAEAKAKDLTVAEVKKRIFKGSEPEHFVEMLSDALDRMGVSPKIEEKVIALQDENKQLRKQLEEARMKAQNKQGGR